MLRQGRFQQLVRAFPIRWRILSIAALNSALGLILLLSILNGAQVLGRAWGELRQVRQTERLLAQIDRETERLQGLIHRYITQADPKILDRIDVLRGTLVGRLREEAPKDALVGDQAAELSRITERFLAGFDELRATRANISRTYDDKISRPSREMAGLYGVIEGIELPSRAAILAPLAKSREAYHAMLLAANAYYLSTSNASATEVGRHAAAIQRTVPVMLDLAEDGIQRLALSGLRDRAAVFAKGVEDLAGDFARETTVLRDEIDGNTEALSAAVESLTAHVRRVESSAQERFDATLDSSAQRLALLALAFLALVAFVGLGVSKSIIEPLSGLRRTMLAIVEGGFGRSPADTDQKDEIGDMARAVEIFRQNALAKLQADTSLLAAKESAEAALSDLRTTQASLVEAEKLAALGGLVAGIAHEVNNPVGIGLTVASSLAHRCRSISSELGGGHLRRSQLTDFIAGVEDAAQMIEANLFRAGELVQSFKQVAVDRSNHERRRFDLEGTCEQIAASLRPGCRAARLTLNVRVAPGIILESYPGPLGQLVTNLCLNAIRHAYPGGDPGMLELAAEPLGSDRVKLTFSDDGRGMTDEVKRRAFEPFFTTSRGKGGTGLGLHIAFNIVTHQLGGTITLESDRARGSRFTVTIPLAAPVHKQDAWVPQFA